MSSFFPFPSPVLPQRPSSSSAAHPFIKGFPAHAGQRRRDLLFQIVATCGAPTHQNDCLRPAGSLRHGLSSTHTSRGTISVITSWNSVWWVDINHSAHVARPLRSSVEAPTLRPIVPLSHNSRFPRRKKIGAGVNRFSEIFHVTRLYHIDRSVTHTTHVS